MSIFIKKNGKRIIPRSIYIKFLIFLVLIGLSAIAMQPLRTVFRSVIANFQTNFIERLEEYTGLEIRYSSIRPAFFGSFDIRNLRLTKEKDDFISISRVRFRFSVRDLLFRGKFTVNSIQIDRPVFNIDMERDRETFELLRSFSNPQGSDRELLAQIAAFLPEKADYRIRGGVLNFHNEKTALKIEDVNIDIKGEGNNILLDAKFDAEVRQAGIFSRTIFLKTGIGLNGIYLTDTDQSRAEIVLSSVSCNEDEKLLFNINTFTFGVSYKDKIVSIISPETNTLIDYFFHYDTETQEVLAEVNCNRFLAGSFISFSDHWKDIGIVLSMPMTGNISFKYENTGAMDYNVNFQIGEVIRYLWNDNYSITDAIAINAYGTEKDIVVNEFWLNMSSDTARTGLFQGIVNIKGSSGFSPLRPAGTISFDRFSFSGGESVSALFRVASLGRDIHITGEKFTTGVFSFKELDIFLYPSERDIGITMTALSAESEAVYLDAVYNRAPSRLEASAALDSFSLFSLSELVRPFANFIDIPDFAAGLTKNTLLDTEIFISTDFNQVVYNAPNVTVRRDSTIGFLSFSGSDRQFTLNESIFYIGDDELFVSANMLFSNPKDLIFAVNANYMNIAWNIEGQFLDRTTLIIYDPNGLHAYANVINSGAVSGYIEGIDFPVPAKSNPIYLDFHTTLRFNTKDFWSVNVAHLKVRNLSSNNGNINFSLSGMADQDGASFRDILYKDNISELAGSADVLWDSGFSYLNLMVNLTDGYETGESYSINGILRNSNFSINAVVSDMHINRFMKSNNLMTASGHVTASWDSIDSFHAQLDLSSLKVRMRKGQIQTSVAVAVSHDELFVSDLMFEYANVRAVLPALQLNISEGIAKADAGLQGFAVGRNIEGNIKFNADFGQIDSWMELRKILDSFKGILEIENIKYGELTQDRIAFDIFGSEDILSVSGGIKDMLKLEIDKAGNFFAGLYAPMPIRGSFAGIYKDGILDAHCGNFYIDMAMLWDLAVNRLDEFSIDGGYITGKIDIKGPIQNPEFFGSGTGTSFRMHVPSYVKNDIRPVPFNFLLEGYELTFGPVLAASGSGGAIASGWLRFEYWIPRNIGLDINIPRETPIPYSLNIVSFHADGFAAGRLDILLDTDNKLYEFTGNFYTNNTEMGISFDDMSTRSDAGASARSVVNMAITTGPMVEFFWPNAASPILRANPNIGTVFRVSADTESGQFSLDGDIRIRSGELYYLDRNFYIRQGNLVFRENERQFDPRITARAEIRDRTDTGPVTISMIIENQPLLSFVPRFEASPSLTQLEIYSILGQSFYNVQGSDTDTAQRFLLASTTDLVSQIFAGSEVLSQFIFMRQFERRMRNMLNLDMLSIRTRFLHNAVATGASGLMSPADWNNRVGNYFDNTTVFIGKYIGQDMFVQSTLTMVYDENRLSFGGLRFEPDIGIELQSPFVNIRWNFFPYHPENWWVNDHTITLHWSFSF